MKILHCGKQSELNPLGNPERVNLLAILEIITREVIHMSICPESNWKTVPIHVMDFEGNRGAGVVEFGVVTVLGGEIVETRSEYCHPNGRIPRRDQELHGITDEDVLDAAPLEEHWSYFAELRENGPLGAHHASVEERLLKQQWSHPRLAPDFLNSSQTTSE